MTDTVRTNAQSLALLPDGTGGAISPQDHRDTYVSLGVYGGIYVAGGAATVAWTSAAKITQFAGDMPSNSVSPAHATDTLTVGTNGAGVYRVGFHLSLKTSSGGASVVEVHLRVGGVEKYIGQHRYLSGTNDTGSLSASGLITLADGDLLTLYGEATTGTPTITIIDGQFWAERLK